MNVHRKFEVRSFTRSRHNRGTIKMWAVPGYAQAQLSPNFYLAFTHIGPVNVPAKFEVRSFTCS